MRSLNVRVLSQVGALAVLAAVLIPITLVVSGFLRRSLQPTSGGVEFLLVLASFFLAFFGLVVVIALTAPLIALSVGYIQHVKDMRQQSPEVRRALEVIRRAEDESWPYARLAAEAPSMAVQVSDNRWLLAEEYFEIGKLLGEKLKDSVRLCGGHVLDVVFARPPRQETRASWTDAESSRTQCPFERGEARLTIMRDTLASQCESRGRSDLAVVFWKRDVLLQADVEEWPYARVASEVPDLAFERDEDRWYLGEEYLEIARLLGEKVEDSVALCGGHVFDVVFARAVREETRASWNHAESGRKKCPLRVGKVGIEAINRSLAYWCVSQSKNELADIFWHRLIRLSA